MACEARWGIQMTLSGEGKLNVATNLGDHANRRGQGLIYPLFRCWRSPPGV